MINKNILHKIFDKVALIQWKNKVNKINKYYHECFKSSNYYYLFSVIYTCCEFKYDAYNWRTNSFLCDCCTRMVRNNYIKHCRHCQKYHPESKNTYIELPKRYKYSSGLNLHNGYKICQNYNHNYLRLIRPSRIPNNT